MLLCRRVIRISGNHTEYVSNVKVLSKTDTEICSNHNKKEKGEISGTYNAERRQGEFKSLTAY